MHNMKNRRKDVVEFYQQQVEKKLCRVLKNEYLFSTTYPEALPRVVVLDCCSIFKASWVTNKE